MGAWIETINDDSESSPDPVAPRVGAWIETQGHKRLRDPHGGRTPVSYTHLDVYKRQVLENLQYAANKQDTIRSSYMNAASATPSAVFSTILKLSNSHYSKLLKDKKGLANFFDNQKKEIIALIHDFPNTLDLNDQGRFFLGYYCLLYTSRCV